jgi:exosome complex RNA-binding protein Rrp42 (RNase PH superfamily)
MNFNKQIQVVLHVDLIVLNVHSHLLNALFVLVLENSLQFVIVNWGTIKN